MTTPFIQFYDDNTGDRISIRFPNDTLEQYTHVRWRLIHDTFSQVPDGDGNVNCSCLVIAHLTDDYDAEALNKDRVALQELFNRAANATTVNDFRLYFRDYYDPDDRNRIAKLLSGSIKPANVTGFSEFKDKTVYRVEWVRSEDWEWSGQPTYPPNPSYGSMTGYAINLTEVDAGRIYQLYSRTKRANSSDELPGITKFWAGIKLQNFWRKKVENVFLDFAPAFNLSGLPDKGIRSIWTDFHYESTGSNPYYPSQYGKVRINFAVSERRLRFFVPMSGWNSYLGSSRNARDRMVGRYRVVIRYALRSRNTSTLAWGDFDPLIHSTEFVLRPVTLWRNYWQANKSVGNTNGYASMPDTYITEPPRHWIVPSNYKPRYQMTEIGEITIGQDAWGANFITTTDVGNDFCFGIEAEQVGDSPSGQEEWVIIIDAILLIPAENYIYMEFDSKFPSQSVRASEAVNIITERIGVVNAYTSNVGGDDGNVVRVATLIDNQNWGIIPYHSYGHTLVVAADTDQADSHSITGVDGLKTWVKIAPRASEYLSR